MELSLKQPTRVNRMPQRIAATGLNPLFGDRIHLSLALLATQ